MTDMHSVLKKQKDYFIKNGAPSYELRIDRLNRMKDIVLKNKDKIVDALNEDFGVRSKNQSMVTDVYSIIPDIEYTKKNLKKWMKVDKRKPSFPFGLLGAKAEVRHEPVGTVGMISPWNFPVNLTFAPLSAVFAAGNQVMHKPSEYTENTANLLKEMCDSAYDEEEFATILGGPEVGAEFSSLHFDHLLYTGSGNVGKLIMKAASENLVPVTLELGGKSPVIIGDGADLTTTAKRVMMGKTMNAGQICLAPDYILVKDSKEQEVVDELKAATAEYYPDIKHNPDYTSIINQKHYDRINGLVDDAKAKGANVEEINPANEDFSQQEAYKIPPTLVRNVNDDMNIMQEEIFGPVMSVLPFDDEEEVIARANDTMYGLAAGVFTRDLARGHRVVAALEAGTCWINTFNITPIEVPFGGVKASGIGRENGLAALDHYTQRKSVIVELGDLESPY